jgi:hypothetical protein
MNATFSPTDPKKCLEIIRAHSCFNLAGKNISEAKGLTTGITSTGISTGFKTGTTATEDLSKKVEQKKEDFKQGATELKQGA